MTQRQQLLSDYEQRRLAREVTIRQRKQAIYQEDQRLHQLEREQHEVVETIIKAGLEAGLSDQAIDQELAGRYAAFYQAQAELLSALGYPADYLSPAYTCPDCQDSGKIGSDDCHCLKQALAEAIYREQSLLDDNLTLSNWTSRIFEDKQRQNAETIYQAMLDYVADSAHHPGRSLIFQGIPGVGKTYLSTALAGSLVEKGLVVIYQTAPDLFEVDFANRQRHKKQLRDADMLIIDDLGKENLTEFVRSDLFNLINHRVRTNKAFLISTNLTLRELKNRYQDDIFSRLTAVCEYYEFIGPELRSHRPRK